MATRTQAEHLRWVREVAEKQLCEAGVHASKGEMVQLVVSELIGNSVRACGDHLPLVIEVDAGKDGVSVKVHDPEPELLPGRRLIALDDAEVESGRGLGLVVLLAPAGGSFLRRSGASTIVCTPPYDEGDGCA